MSYQPSGLFAGLDILEPWEDRLIETKLEASAERCHRNCVGGQGVKHLLDALESNFTLLTLDRKGLVGVT